jgi:hypothetical protein
MIYVFDTNSLIVTSHYYPQQFHSFWENFDEAVESGQIISTREVFNELDNNACKPHLLDWINRNKNIFLIPTPEETSFVQVIFNNSHFMQSVSRSNILKGMPVSDPFVVALAKIKNATVVTEEVFKPNASKIPNICNYHKINCINIEKFMEQEGWQF